MNNLGNVFLFHKIIIHFSCLTILIKNYRGQRDFLAPKVEGAFRIYWIVKCFHNQMNYPGNLR